MPTCESDRLVEIILGMAGHRIVTSYTESAPDRHYDIPANGEMRWSQYALMCSRIAGCMNTSGALVIYQFDTVKRVYVVMLGDRRWRALAPDEILQNFPWLVNDAVACDFPPLGGQNGEASN